MIREQSKKDLAFVCIIQRPFQSVNKGWLNDVPISDYLILSMLQSCSIDNGEKANIDTSKEVGRLGSSGLENSITMVKETIGHPKDKRPFNHPTQGSPEDGRPDPRYQGGAGRCTT